MTSPLTPIPALPWGYTDAAGVRLVIDRGSGGDVVLRANNIPSILGGTTALVVAHISPEARAAFAAAILAGSTARVIDLGELPEVERRVESDDTVSWRCDGIIYDDSEFDFEASRRTIFRRIAVLEARDKASAAKAAHDPAEVEALVEVMVDIWGGGDDLTAQSYRHGAGILLDALDRVRGADQ